jgi:hypothetical protein
MQAINDDGIVKSPDAAMGFITRHCVVRQVRLVPCDLLALPSDLIHPFFMDMG